MAETRARAAGLVVAAGQGRRFGSDKIWQPLGGLPLVAWSVRALAAAPSVGQLVLVVAPERLAAARMLLERLQVWAGVACAGGARRQDSVRAGLAHVGDWPWVVVHDGARPFVTPDLVEAGVRAAEATGAAVAAIPVTDTVKQVQDETVVATLERASLRAVQTPQVFRRDLLVRAHQQADDEVTDDAALVERLGVAVRVFAGASENLKVTTPLDWVVAECLYQRGLVASVG